MFKLQDSIDMKSCRICLVNNKPLCPLFRHKLSGNYAEMLTAIADIKVYSNDGLPEKICIKCCTTLEKAYLLKTVAERSDRKLRKIFAKRNGNVATKKIAFDSFTDIKSEIGPISMKTEPKWEMEIDINNGNLSKPVETIDGKDIVIANTVIRKVDPNNSVETKPETIDEDVNVTWKKTSPIDDIEEEYLDDAFQDDFDDDDYIPPTEKQKSRFKEPKLSEIKVFKGKPVIRKIKVIKKIRDDYDGSEKHPRTTSITCYPILKNGSRGKPIILKRPKDSTVLKIHPKYKTSDDPKVISRDKPMRTVRGGPAKQREKLVCPVCGILTYSLGHHIATHQEKKKYSCSQCPRTFTQKGNLHIHSKRHTGIKDHICEICGVGYYSKKALVRHKLTHKREKPYSCNLCNKGFISTQNLRCHMRIHTGDKPFKCDICDKSFVQHHHLRNHTLTHTGDKPFSCEVCNVAFGYKVNLNNHVFKVHGINLKFKSIRTVTEDVLQRELDVQSESSVAISHIMPQLSSDVPAAAAHETVHHTTEL